MQVKTSTCVQGLLQLPEVFSPAAALNMPSVGGPSTYDTVRTSCRKHRQGWVHGGFGGLSQGHKHIWIGRHTLPLLD